MCGIAGFLGPWSGALLSAMTEAIAHRGPDGSGLVFEPAAGLGLGHRRLSIIDLSNVAAQPMRTPDGRYLITYNGEIYNYRALRRALAADGVRFQSDSDTEILLALFAHEGLACLDRLDGIFAFAVWDTVERRLTLARDHLGVKPLYYAELPRGFLFASEIKSLALCPDLPRDIDPATVADLMATAWSAGEGTMLRAVRKLRPGCAMVVDDDGVRITRYYRTPLAGAAASDSSPGALRDLIDTVVADQMVADVEVGALLSGGVDSSAIVASMCRAAEPARITTFCASVSDAGGGADNFGDDLAHAREVAEALGVRLIEVPTEADLLDELPAMVWSLDEPSADFAALQTRLLARAAREDGIKVLLSGVGGDDLFTGYGRHTAAMIYARLGHVPGARSVASRLLRRADPESLRGRRLQRMGALLGMAEDEMLEEAMSFSPVTGPERVRLFAAHLRDGMDGHSAALRDSLGTTRGRHPVERLLDMELNGFLPDLNLNYSDKMAMREGVEIRVPLVDRRLVAHAARLPLSARMDLRRTKKILRRSQRGRVPGSVLGRPKQGFGVPIRAWLRGPARALMEELTGATVIEARGLFDADAATALREGFLAGRNDAAMTLFPMMTAELWCRALDGTETVGSDDSTSVLQPGASRFTLSP